MKLLKSKTGKFSFAPEKAGVMLTSVILLIIALKVFAKGLPEIAEAGNDVYDGNGVWNGTHWTTQQSAFPLTSLFQSDNVLVLAIVGGVLVAIVLQVIPGKKK